MVINHLLNGMIIQALKLPYEIQTRDSPQVLQRFQQTTLQYLHACSPKKEL